MTTSRDNHLVPRPDHPAPDGWGPDGRAYPYVDPIIEATVIKHCGPDDTWLVAVAPMLFNDRILLLSTASYPFHVAGFCYDKGPAAPLAAAVWDPEVDKNPAGFKKIAFDGRR